MYNLNKILNYIEKQSQQECEDIAENAVIECDTIRDQYAQKEQDEYWKFLGKAANETEQRLIQLGELTKKEAQKKIDSTRQEMADVAFALAAEKIAALPDDEYKQILKRLNLNPTLTSEALVNRYKELLQPSVEAILFN